MDEEEESQLYSFDLRLRPILGECCSLDRRALFWGSFTCVYNPFMFTAIGALGFGAGNPKSMWK